MSRKTSGKTNNYNPMAKVVKDSVHYTTKTTTTGKLIVSAHIKSSKPIKVWNRDRKK